METKERNTKVEGFLEGAGFQGLMTCIVGIIILVFLGFVLYSFGVPMKPFYYIFGALFFMAFAWALVTMIRKIRQMRNP